MWVVVGDTWAAWAWGEEHEPAQKQGSWGEGTGPQATEKSPGVTCTSTCLWRPSALGMGHAEGPWLAPWCPAGSSAQLPAGACQAPASPCTKAWLQCQAGGARSCPGTDSPTPADWQKEQLLGLADVALVQAQEQLQPAREELVQARQEWNRSQEELQEAKANLLLAQGKIQNLQQQLNTAVRALATARPSQVRGI